MDRPIQVGDLVVVVKPTPCCGNGSSVGLHFVVEKIEGGFGHCLYCTSLRIEGLDAKAPGRDWVQVSRLKRIPPPEELGIVDEREEITA